MRGPFLCSLALTALALSSAAEAAPMRTVRITSTPPGATVYLDDTSAKPLGVTPIRRVRIPYGFHEIIFVLEGHATVKERLNVGRGTRRVTAELPKMAKVMVSAGSADARGAQVLIDGEVRGEVPWSGFVPPGRHQIQVEKDGFAPFGDWVELAPGQILTLPAVLAPARALGTIFVTADLSGAEVLVDGQREGVTPVLVEVPAGKAVVEVRAPGRPPWRKTVEVAAGDKSIVEAVLREDTGPTGTALILSNVAGTRVWVDGTRTGTAPVTLEGLAVGTHIVEGKAEGYTPAQSTVRVNAGEQSVVKLELTPAKTEYGRISVRAAVPGAQVFIDGGAQGPAPVELDEVPLGPHAITVRAEGHADFEATCEVKRNQTCSVMAVQTPLARIRVVAPETPGARLFIDGKEMGPLPYEGTVSADMHTLRVEAPHHRTKEERLTFEPSKEVRELSFDLASTGTSPEEVSRRKRRLREAQLARYEGASHVSGVPPAPGKNRIYFGVGVPYIFEGGGTVGIVEHLAVNVGARVLERQEGIGSVDFLLGAHTGWRILEPLSIGAKLTGWGGSNFERDGSVATVGAILKAMATLHFGDRAQFSLTLAGEVFHDDWSDEEDIRERNGEPDDKQGGIRLHAGGQLLLWIKENIGVWGSFDWRVAGTLREMYQQNYFGAIDRDPEVYLKLGMAIGF